MQIEKDTLRFFISYINCANESLVFKFLLPSISNYVMVRFRL